MDDLNEMTTAEMAREISKAVGDIHAEMLLLRRAGIPARALPALDRVESKLTRLADLNAGLGEAIRRNEEALVAAAQ